MDMIITMVLASSLWCVSGYFIRGAIDSHRRRKAAERAAQHVAERLAEVTQRIAQSMGAFVGTRVDPDQIRTGDRIHWHDRADSESCVEYTAGFNGDTAGKTTGEWIKRNDR